MFITRMEGDKSINEGLCIKCAKEMNIKPVTDLAAEGTLSGIVLQQVSQHLGAGQVVDCDDLVTLSIKHLTESQTTNTTETIDSNSNSHVNSTS